MISTLRIPLNLGNIIDVHLVLVSVRFSRGEKRQLHFNFSLKSVIKNMHVVYHADTGSKIQASLNPLVTNSGSP